MLLEKLDINMHKIKTRPLSLTLCKKKKKERKINSKWIRILNIRSETETNQGTQGKHIKTKA
jgi:hypothetical protein